MKNNLLPKFIITIAFVLLLLLGSTIVAATYKTIAKCQPGSNDPCYEEINSRPGVKKAQIKNLDTEKSYEFLIKEKKDGEEILVGTARLEKDINKSSDFCSDSDGGKNYEQKGQVIHNNIVKEDECETEEGAILIEYFCDNGRLAEDIVECSGGLCRDGACVYDFVRDCTDSDKGIDIYNKGTLNWSVQGFVTSDECSNSTTLKEYFCVGSGPSSSYQVMIYNCPNGCADGACNKPEPGTKASGECKAAGEYVYADPLISYRQMLLGFNCCAGLVGKVDYFAKNDWSGATCCLPSQCALDTACFNEGPSGVFGVDGTEPVCKNGSWY